ncbi:MAG: hypothetical protein WCV85_01845 [Patescibacteria group bacterium]
MKRSFACSDQHDVIAIDRDDPDLLQIGHLVGVHEVCGGTVFCRASSQTHHAMCCNTCGLRVVVPNTIDTFGELLEHFQILGFPKLRPFE